MKVVKKVKSSKKTAVVSVQSNLPALPPEWERELEEEARAASAGEAPSVAQFSLKSGTLSYNQLPMPNNKVRAIVLATAEEHSFFIGKFDPNNIVSPVCFALGEAKPKGGNEMVPHDNSYEQQSDSCGDCAMAEWGSDDNSPSGRGRACKWVRRLGLIPEDALEEDVAKATVALLRLPVTSVRNWSNYVHLLDASVKRPPFAVVTEISVVPDQKTQFQVKFQCVDVIMEPDILQELKDNRRRAFSIITQPFNKMTEEQYKQLTAPPPKRGKSKY